MQAVILAAGKGSRLHGFNNNLPKCFLEIKHKRILDYQLDFLYEAGIRDILMVVGYKKDLIINEYKSKNISFIENPFFGITNVLASFWFVKKYLNDDFLYFHSDTVFHKRIFEKLLAYNGNIGLPIDQKEEYKDEDMKVRIINNQIVEISKTIPNNIANGEFLGIAKIKKRIFPNLSSVTDELIYSEKYTAFFELALQRLIENNTSIDPIIIGDLPWNEIDFIEDYERIKDVTLF